MHQIASSGALLFGKNIPSALNPVRTSPLTKEMIPSQQPHRMMCLPIGVLVTLA